MKNLKSILLVLSLVVSSVLSAKDWEKDYREMIGLYDVPVSVRQLTKENKSSDFWDALLNDNLKLKKLKEDIEKGRGAEKEALRRVDIMSIYDIDFEPGIMREYDAYMDSLRIEMGISADWCSLHVCDDDSPNAFTGLTIDNKFCVFVNKGLFNLFTGDEDMLIGTIAHELAHGLLKHHLDTEYAVAKKKRKDKILAGIAIGLQCAAAVAETYMASTSGVEANPEAYAENIEEIMWDLDKRKILYRYKYYRGNELEADLVAFRFMQWKVGDGEKYIRLLQRLRRFEDIGADLEADEKGTNELSDHPSAYYRIQMLRYAGSHPEAGNKWEELERKREAKKSAMEKDNKVYHDDIYM